MRRALAAGLLSCALAAYALAAQAQVPPAPTPPANAQPSNAQPAAAPTPEPRSAQNPPPGSGPAPAAEGTSPAAEPPPHPPKTAAPRPAPAPAPPPAEVDSAHEAEVAALRAEVNRLQSELDAEHAAALPPNEETSDVPPARSPWGWLVATALLALAAGFLLGWRLLDRRIRRKYGGLRIY